MSAIKTKVAGGLLEGKLVRAALWDALRKLSPRTQWANPVMFVVYLGAMLTSLLWVQGLMDAASAHNGFTLAIALWLWFTVLFANFAEALAEGRSRAQAASLRGMKRDTVAKVLEQPQHGAAWIPVRASELRKGVFLLVEAGDVIALDGTVVQGVASVDESAITGESAPVIREAGGDFSSVTGGTRVLSDWLVVEVTVNPGESFLDRMISMVESAKRQKTPNELALTILLVGLTLVFLLVIVTLWPFSAFAVAQTGSGSVVGLAVLIALLVCLIPTTIGGLLSAIGVAGMSRMMQANVIATSGRAVEAAGDVDVLLLDKTGTITLGNRQASEFFPAPGVTPAQLAEAAQLSSLADETPEGRSVVALARERHGLPERSSAELQAEFVAFTAQTRMSGVDLATPQGLRSLRKGAADAVRRHIEALGGSFPAPVQQSVDNVSRKGSTPLVVADGAKVLGVIELKDIVKPGMRERFAELRRMGIQTVMVTGDNPLTAAAIAAEAGVDDYLAEARPEDKLQLIRNHQAAGRLVAMTGD
ncbi:MAG: potassium-transporting ATPase subunit KdpB, partial [Acidovorax sp.]|nr:potassium-transporting ATPase subunit KdpB [Acidovorax sp.]